MQAAHTPEVAEAIQNEIANESATMLSVLIAWNGDREAPLLTSVDARCMVDCLRNNPRLCDFVSWGYRLHDAAALNVFRNDLPSCTEVSTVGLHNIELSNEGLERLLPAFYNTSVVALSLGRNNIQGQRGGELIRDLLVGNNVLLGLDLMSNPIGPEGAIGTGKGIAGNRRLQELNLSGCNFGNNGLANLVLYMGDVINNSLTELDLSDNNIEGAEGGRLVGLLLQRFPILKVLHLNSNRNFGPLGACALGPVLILPNLVLEGLRIRNCNIGEYGVANLIPDGEANRSLTFLDLGIVEESVLSLASRCTNLDRVTGPDLSTWLDLSPDQRRRLDLLLDRKRLHTEALSLGGSPPAVIFQKLVQANSHEHGLSASFVILRD